MEPRVSEYIAAMESGRSYTGRSYISETNAIREIARLARLGSAVENLARGAGIIRMRDPERGWRLVESAAETGAPALYYCGETMSALEACQIHRKGDE